MASNFRSSRRGSSSAFFSSTLLLLLLVHIPGQSLGEQQFQLALLKAIQQNPSLIQTIRSNPALVQSLLLQQQKSASSSVPQKVLYPFSSSKGLSDLGLTDQCSALRHQNARLKQIIRAFTDDVPPAAALLHGGLGGGGDNLLLNQALGRSQRELNPAQLLLQQAVQDTTPKISVQKVLVTPSATWSTVVSSSLYETTVTTSLSTEVPIIIRGNKVYTTIVQPHVQTGRSLMIPSYDQQCSNSHLN